eukprot:CAMPEP_0174255438 /NCGR_PEP_ID=MMETSP0439-20130205/4779_1 /TAXON_ID=0 /ORGANISM="Stereomyxa ramosa, Strain Chinc5" /LENGTH=91 /DNA_ID=CAMNT_0015337629 /DNA_START=32 /DNA_END=304 /DNA_ORIENTATION=+
METATITTTTATTTLSQDDGDTLPLSSNFLDTGKIRYSSGSGASTALKRMEEKHPLREADTCWFSPDNPDDDPRWNKPNSEYYEKLITGYW